MQLNVRNVNGVKREFPNWATRAKIKKVDADGNILEGQYSFNGEVVRVSPRFTKGGQHYRVRPERPAAFFAAFLYEVGVMPELLTAQECEEPWALELLDPLWAQYQGSFYKLASAAAACDTSTVPNHRIGFSFNLLQILVEQIGAVRGSTTARPAMPNVNGSTTSSSILESISRRIQEQRAKAANKQEPPAPGKKKS